MVPTPSSPLLIYMALWCFHMHYVNIDKGTDNVMNDVIIFLNELLS